MRGHNLKFLWSFKDSVVLGAIWTGAQTIHVTHTPGLHPKYWPSIRKRYYPKPTLQSPAKVPEWPDGAWVSLQPPGLIFLQTLATVMGKDAPSLSITPARCASFPRQHQVPLQLSTTPLTSKAELPVPDTAASSKLVPSQVLAKVLQHHHLWCASPYPFHCKYQQWCQGTQTVPDIDKEPL